jgi:hypothetical protein
MSQVLQAFSYGLGHVPARARQAADEPVPPGRTPR